MPYSGPDDPKLPENIQGKSEDDRSQWVAVWNDVYESCVSDGGDSADCEGKAFASANASIRSAGTPKERKGSMDELGEKGVFRQIWKMLNSVFGKEDINKEEKARAVSVFTIYDQLWDSLIDDEGYPEAWLSDVYMENDKFFGLVADEGKLYRVDISLDEEDNPVFGERLELDLSSTRQKGRSKSIIYRQDDGSTIVAAIVCTATINRVAEIDSRALFDSFVEHARETGEYPFINLYHLGDESRVGEVIYMNRDGNVLLQVYKFDDTVLGRAAARGLAEDPDYWGYSIEYMPMAYELMEVANGVNIPVYTAGVNRATSILPEDKAASMFTQGSIYRGVSRMRKDIKDDVQKILNGDEEAINELESKIDGVNRTIENEGIISRATDEETVDETEVEETEEETEEEVDNENVDEEETEEVVSEDNLEVEDELVIDDSVIAQVISGILESEQFADVFGDNSPVNEIRQMLTELTNRVNESNDTTSRAIKNLGLRLESLEAPEQERQKEWSAQLPAQYKRKVVYRPSIARGENKDGDDLDTDYATEAESTISKWKGSK